MRVFLIFLFAMFAVATMATPTGKGNSDPGHRGQGRRKEMTKDDKDKLKANCQKKGNKCRGQTDAYRKKRDNAKAFLTEQLKIQSSLSERDAAVQAETRLNKIQELKKKIHTKHSLTDIEPADTGLWQKDIILTDKQIDEISQALDNPRAIVDTPAEAKRQKRSAANYFEQKPSSRWKMPIHYWVSNAFSSSEKATIDSALQTITKATGCITFTKDTTRLTSGSQIQYVKTGSDGCYGQSTIGYIGIQTVDLATTSWCTGDILKGLVMHESIHALGGGHEQSRMDRDDYIDILWDNIDPQEWAQYDQDTSTTSYGVAYDYLSVMHYEQGLFAVTDGLNTMSPKVSTKLGGNVLTSNDILQLKRMYCRPSTCTDLYQDCGSWAIDGYCKDAQWLTWMGKNCGRSCGVC